MPDTIACHGPRIGGIDGVARTLQRDYVKFLSVSIATATEVGSSLWSAMSAPSSLKPLAPVSMRTLAMGCRHHRPMSVVVAYLAIFEGCSEMSG